MINKRLSIIWGTKENGFIPETLVGYAFNALATTHPLVLLKEKIGAHSIILNHQVHGIKGHVINNKEVTPSTLLTTEGDFLITNQPGIGLGILTADCLPLIIYDPNTHTVALIHAGWKGAVQGIIQKAIETLENTYCIKPESLIVLWGPAAQSCCYEIKNDFHTHFKDDSYAKNCFEERDGRLFFSLSRYSNAILDTYNIPENQRDFSAHYCTICTDKYYSYRKDKKTQYRNITVVLLQSLLI